MPSLFRERPSLPGRRVHLDQPFRDSLGGQGRLLTGQQVQGMASDLLRTRNDQSDPRQRTDMEKVSIIDFFRTGALGPLTIGTSRSGVRKLLGEPGELPGPQFRHRQAPVWKYGMLVLHFA